MCSPQAVFCNQNDHKPSAGVNFYRDKLRALVNDGHANGAAHMYSYVLSHALSAVNVIVEKRSPEYASHYQEALRRFVREYSYLVNPILNVKH